MNIFRLVVYSVALFTFSTLWGREFESLSAYFVLKHSSLGPAVDKVPGSSLMGKLPIKIKYANDGSRCEIRFDSRLKHKIIRCKSKWIKADRTKAFFIKTTDFVELITFLDNRGVGIEKFEFKSDEVALLMHSNKIYERFSKEYDSLISNDGSEILHFGITEGQYFHKTYFRKRHVLIKVTYQNFEMNRSRVLVSKHIQAFTSIWEGKEMCYLKYKANIYACQLIEKNLAVSKNVFEALFFTLLPKRFSQDPTLAMQNFNFKFVFPDYETKAQVHTSDSNESYHLSMIQRGRYSYF